MSRLLRHIGAAAVAGSVAWACRPRPPARADRASVLPLTPRRILVVKLADLGDAIGAEPALASLRAGFPGARLDVLVSPAARQALATCPHLDEIIDFEKGAYDSPASVIAPGKLAAAAVFGLDLRRRRYELVVILHHLNSRWGAHKFRWVAAMTGSPFVAGLDNGRGDFLTHAAPDRGFGDQPEWRYWLDIVRALGISPVDRPPRFCIPPDEQARADELLMSLSTSGSQFVSLHVGVGGYAPIKQWPVERMVAVAREIIARTKATVLVVGGPDLVKVGQEIATKIGPGAVNLTGRTSVPVLAGILKRCGLVMGNDSGIAHLGSAVGSQTLTLFGPTNANAWAPAGSRVLTLGHGDVGRVPGLRGSSGIALRLGEPCSPCHYVGFSVRARLPCSHRNCLQRLSAKVVSEISVELLAER